MKTARIADQHATDALSAFVDEDISAVMREEHMAAEVAEIEALIEEAEREWAAADRDETFRVSRDLTDQVRARRARRRVDRVVLRSLPARLDAGEAA